ncbi:MAG TPA: hypothetical protein VEI97_07000, partial [bacterium]|nr:hypothetical protein [bacterium]
MPAPMPGPEPGATPAQLTRESQDGVDRFTLSADGPITVDVTTARYPNRILLTISGRPVEFQGLATGKTRFFKGSVASSVRLMPGADPNTTTIQIALDRPLDQVQHGYRDGILEIRALALPEPEPMAAEPAVTPGPAPVAEPAATDPVPVPIEEPATAVEPEPAPAAEAPVEEPPAPLAMPEPEPVLPVAAEAPVTLKMGKSSVRAIVNKLRPLTSTKITIDPLVTGTTAVEFSELTVAEALHQLAAQTNLEIEDRGGELHLRPGPKPVAMPEPEPVIEEPVPAVEPEPAAAVEPVAEEPVPTTEGPVAMPEPEPVQAIQEPAPMPAVVTEPEPTPAIEEPAPAVETPAPAPLPAATDLVTTFDFDNVDIRQVLDTIRPLTSSRITADPRVKGPVTIHLKDQPLDAALREIAAAGGYLLSVKNDVYFFKPAPTVVQPAPQPDPTPAVIEEPAPPVEEPVAEPEPTVAEPAAGPAPAVEEPVAEPEPAVSEPRPMAELEPMPAPAAEPEPEPLKPAYEVVD